MKRILAYLFLYGLFLLLGLTKPPSIFAQGTFSCGWTSLPGTPGICDIVSSNCTTGNSAVTSTCLANTTPSTCTGSYACERSTLNCSGYNGHCTPIISKCAQGNQIGSSGELGCIVGFRCCPNPSANPTSCQSLGGHCVISGSCANGPPINSSDCTIPLMKCCPNVNSPSSVLCNGGTGINTAIGCLDASNSKNLTSQLLTLATGIAGGIAFIIIIFAGLQMATAAGDPKRFKAGQELLTSGIGGLILIVLAVLILNFLGVTLLNLNSVGFQTP